MQNLEAWVISFRSTFISRATICLQCVNSKESSLLLKQVFERLMMVHEWSRTSIRNEIPIGKFLIIKPRLSLSNVKQRLCLCLCKG